MKPPALAPLVIKAAVWLGFAAVFYVLRSFFLLIFLTFVFAFIQAKGVDRLSRFSLSRTTRVVIVGLAFLGVLIGFGLLITPRIAEQAKLFVERYPGYIDRLDDELLAIASDYPAAAGFLPPAPEKEEELLHYSPTAEILQQLLGIEHGKNGEGMGSALTRVREIGGKALGIGSAFLLSLLFSFLIVLDLPALSESARSLRNTRIRFIYDEVAPSIQEFCAVLGKALEAQLFIALLNTVLTALGLVLIGVTEKMAFLLLIVFLCSFIPVAGVFISSVPICLLSLQQAGFSHLLLAVLMITVIHMIEAYILNPKIYGHHMHLNPVIVLIILTIGGKTFGVWGLVLGVPICTYIFGYAIRDRLQEALDELPSAT